MLIDFQLSFAVYFVVVSEEIKRIPDKPSFPVIASENWR